MSLRRRATRRDLPALCMFYCVLIVAFAAVFSSPKNDPLAKEGAFQSVSGTVQRVFHGSGRGGNYFNLIVQAPDGLHRLTEEDLLTETVPGMRRFVPGDVVTAEVKHDTGKNLDWCWSITRNGQVLLTREQTARYLEKMSARNKRAVRIVDEAAIAISIFLLATAIILRRRYGAWTDQQATVSI